MKKILLNFILAFAFIGVNAQCTPEPQFTIAGIYPDSATGLTPAYVGQPYNQIITIISPLDTIVELTPGLPPISVTVQTIELTSVTGLPSNFTYSCLAPNCIFPGGSTSCALLSTTTNPTSADIGSHQIIFKTTTTVDAGLPIPITQVDSIDYYYLEVTNATSVVNQFNEFTFELKDVFPNPVNGNSKIQFISGNSTNIIFNVFNYLGEKMDEQIITTNRGVNEIAINANNYPNGMYLYSINNGERVLSKRMVIVN